MVDKIWMYLAIVTWLLPIASNLLSGVLRLAGAERASKVVDALAPMALGAIAKALATRPASLPGNVPLAPQETAIVKAGADVARGQLVVLGSDGTARPMMSSTPEIVGIAEAPASKGEPLKIVQGS